MILPYCLFSKASPTIILTIYIIKEHVFDFNCCPSALNSNVVELLLKDLLVCIRKFVESDDEIRVIWNVGDIVCCEYGILGMLDVGNVGCPGCGMFGVWDVRGVGCSGCEMYDVRDVACSCCGMFSMRNVYDVGCSGYGMLGMLDVWGVGCSGCRVFRIWDVGDV